MAYVPNMIAKTQDYAPGYSSADPKPGQVTRDAQGYLQTRGEILTDEGGYRDNASGTGVGWAVGTLTFVNGQATATGTGILNFPALSIGDYIKLASDDVSAWNRIEEHTDTTITLEDNYTGAGGTGSALVCILHPKVGTGTSVTLAGGNYTLTSGVTDNAVVELERDADVLPLTKRTGISISQRIANQDIYVGFYDDLVSPSRYFARFRFNGLDSTKVITESGWAPLVAPAAGTYETNLITLPASISSASQMNLWVECIGAQARFYVNNTLVSTHYKDLPRPQDFLTSTIQIVNGTGVASSTAVNVYYDHCENFNRITVANSSQADTVDTANALQTEMVAVLNSLRVTLSAFTNSFGTAIDINGRQRVNVEAGSLTVNSTAMSTFGAANYSANDQIPAMLALAAQNLRSGITVS